MTKALQQYDETDEEEHRDLSESLLDTLVMETKTVMRGMPLSNGLIASVCLNAKGTLQNIIVSRYIVRYSLRTPF